MSPVSSQAAPVADGSSTALCNHLRIVGQPSRPYQKNFMKLFAVSVPLDRARWSLHAGLLLAGPAIWQFTVATILDHSV